MKDGDRDALFMALLERLKREDHWVPVPFSWTLRNSDNGQAWLDAPMEEKLSAWIVATDEDYEILVQILIQYAKNKGVTK